MQIEIPAQKVLDKLGARVGQLTTEVVHLQVTNEVLTERLQEAYQEISSLRAATEPAPQPPSAAETDTTSP